GREAQMIDRPGDLAVRGIQLVVASLHFGRDLGHGGLGDDRAACQQAKRHAGGADAAESRARDETLIESHRAASRKMTIWRWRKEARPGAVGPEQRCNSAVG